MQQSILKISGKSFIHYLLLLCFAFSNSVLATSTPDDATLQVNFPGLSSVHTEIRVSDGIADSASGEYVKKSNWKSNSTTVDVPQGVYDLIIRKGAGTLIIDAVDCQANTCEVNDIVALLTVDFLGLSSVHTSVKVVDNVAGEASGGEITKKNWQSNQVIIPVLRQVVDVNVRKGAGNIVIDEVDCRSGSCAVNELTATLRVLFDGLSSVHTSAHLPDGVLGTAQGEEVTHKNWQSNQAEFTVLRQVYDLKVRKNEQTIVVDNVDCTSGNCEVDELTANMVVNFAEISSVHVSVREPDDIGDEASGAEVTNKNWQSNQAQITVFRNRYDLYIRKGAGAIVVDDVDCSSGNCTVDNLTANLTVNFPGLTSMHLKLYNPDDVAGTATGEEVLHKNWQSNQTVLTMFKGVYDFSIRRGNTTPIIKDDIDCRSGVCEINDLVATLSVAFDGMSSVHTTVSETDDQDGVAEGSEFTHKNWQSDQTLIAVLRQVYDVSVKRSTTLPVIIDNVDCTSGACAVENLTATLTVKFPELKSVHTSAYVTDGVAGELGGQEAFRNNWKTDQAELIVFKQVYDIGVRKGHSETMVIDNVDCRPGICEVDGITALMTVEFEGMSAVHTSVRVPDLQAGVAEGGEVTKKNWQKDDAVITVFKQVYDVSVRRGGSDSVIIDELDCTSGTCVVNEITATLTVDFPGIKSVHTSVRVPDDADGTAEGSEVTRLNWQKDDAVITVFRQVYDLRVRKGAITKVIDNVDCSSGACLVNEITAVLTIDFPGLISVHSSVHLPDGVDNTAEGELVDKSNWKTHQTTIALLRETYDVKVKHSVTSVFDNVDCNSASCEVLITGNVQAKLIDGDTNAPLADKNLYAYEKLANGELVKVAKGRTTEQGQVNFTLPDITLGKVYVLKTHNPFGNHKSYFSAFITSEGEHNFIITVDGENSLDLTPPTIAIVTPVDGSSVSDTGFQVSGSASDNREIDRIELTIVDPVKGSNSITASYDANTEAWTAAVPGTMITIDNNVVVTATAFDLAQSQTTSTVTVLVVEDTVGPEILFTSHVDNDTVSVSGFLLSGTVTDLTGVDTLQATLVDSVLGETISNQTVDFSINDGIWTLVVNNGLMSEDATVVITFDAADTVGNTSTKTITLTAEAVNVNNAQVINRITFGVTPALIQEVEVLGAQGFLDQQLDPGAIDDSNFTAMIAGNTPTTKEELKAWSLLHMVYSQRQLQEVMTWFWDNHFNTDVDVSRTDINGVEVSNTVAFELNENQGFRANALGNFRDLLGISASSPSMLIYLDSISNGIDDSNENYTREVLELHTLGVDGGFDHHEIQAGAEIFTGWHLQNGLFTFNDAQHNSLEHTVLGVIVPAGGVEQGQQFLDIISRHPSTASFICTKLITVFVSDTPPSSLVTRCQGVFMSNTQAPDQIELVLREILESVEFFDAANFRSKIKTPVEFVVSALRALDANSTATDLDDPISAMGIRLYENPVPTGWSEIGSDWMNSALLIERIKWVNDFVRNPTTGSQSASADPVAFYTGHGFATADGIVGFLFELTAGDDVTDLARQNALQVLGNNFDISNQEQADALLRQLNGTVMSYPQFQFQ